MMNYISSNASDSVKKDYWIFCEKNEKPYIEISDLGNRYCQIFFDITNFSVNHETVSDFLRGVYRAYIDFFMIDESDIVSILDDVYLFRMVVRKEHKECIVDGLFAYLVCKIKGA